MILLSAGLIAKKFFKILPSNTFTMLTAYHHAFLQYPRSAPAHHGDNSWRPTFAHDTVLQSAEDEVLLFYKEEEGSDYDGELQECADIRRQCREARGGAGGADRRSVPATPLQRGKHQVVAECCH